MDFKKMQEEIIWPSLDKYKQAWMEDENIANVQAIKNALEESIRQATDNSEEAIDYFESQCHQIEARWGRPKSENIH